MGVYIKGLEMPKSCADCPFRMCFGYDDEIDCTLIKGAFMAYPDSHERRHKDCPLVEVKEPHGDLIDRDAILSFIDAGHLSNPATKSWNDTEVVDMLKSRHTCIEAEGKDDG